jgi:hypothetical protein
MKRSIFSGLLGIIFCGISSAFGWGDEGHETVGAIADQLLVGTPAAEHVRALLGDETLSTASIWADQIRSRTNQWPEAVAFRAAVTNHAVMHYTDIPFEESKYRDDSIGARPNDVVHAIDACILILQGRTDEQTVFTNVNQKIALRLLAHYVGDLHMPLHAGSGYLDGTNFIDPNGYGKPYDEDLGGNQLILGTNKLHFYWDVTVVEQAMTNASVKTPLEYAAKLLAAPAPHWETLGPLLDWPRDWADESIALSARIHQVRITSEEDAIDRYTGKHRPRWHIADLTPEEIAWDDATAESQLTKAGYRLAKVLETIWP